MIIITNDNGKTWTLSGRSLSAREILHKPTDPNRDQGEQEASGNGMRRRTRRCSGSRRSRSWSCPRRGCRACGGDRDAELLPERAVLAEGADVVVVAGGGERYVCWPGGDDRSNRVFRAARVERCFRNLEYVVLASSKVEHWNYREGSSGNRSTNSAKSTSIILREYGAYIYIYIYIYLTCHRRQRSSKQPRRRKHLRLPAGCSSRSRLPPHEPSVPRKIAEARPARRRRACLRGHLNFPAIALYANLCTVRFYIHRERTLDCDGAGC